MGAAESQLESGEINTILPISTIPPVATVAPTVPTESTVRAAQPIQNATPPSFATPHPPATLPPQQLHPQQLTHEQLLSAQLTLARQKLTQERGALNRRHLKKDQQWHASEMNQSAEADAEVVAAAMVQFRAYQAAQQAAAAQAAAAKPAPVAPASVPSACESISSSSSSAFSHPAMTPAEAELAYLIWSVQTNSSQQHVDVLAKQIDLLKEKMEVCRKEKEKEMEMEQKQQRQEENASMHAVDHIIDDTIRSPNTFDNNASTQDEIEIHFPDAKKLKLQHAASTTTTIHAYHPSPNPFFVPHDCSGLDQFQLMRDTSEMEDEVDNSARRNHEQQGYLYGDSDTLLHGDAHDDSYEAVSARMNAIVQDAHPNNDEVTMSDIQVVAPPLPALYLPPHAAASAVSAVFTPTMNSSSSSGNSTNSDTSTHFITPSEASRVKLDFLLGDRVLHHLEQKYERGEITLDGVRYELTVFRNLLEPEHEKELVEEFEKMRVVVQGGGRRTGGDEKQQDVDTPASASATLSSPSIIHQALSQLPDYRDTYTPSEPVEDDPDGVARMRIMTWATSTSAVEAEKYLQQDSEKKRRRSVKDGGDVESAAAAVVSSSDSIVTASSVTSTPAASALASPMHPIASSTVASAVSTITPTATTLHRLLYVNRSFERLTGFTQSMIHSLGIHAISRIERTLRKDHYHAALRIQKKWWNDGQTTNTKMYQVHSRGDGSWMYCIVDFKGNESGEQQGRHSDGGGSSSERRRRNQAVICIVPLPENDPMPPFVEGVDLDEETLLYGYKLPSMMTTTAAVCVPPASRLVGIELNPGPSTIDVGLTASVSSSLSLVAATSWSTTSDILRSIFSFLSFHEFMRSTITVSQTWYQQATRQSSYEMEWPLSYKTYDAKIEQLIASPSTSPFLSHLTKLSIASPTRPYTSSQYPSFLESIIALTQTHLHHLNRITINTSFVPPHATAVPNFLPLTLSLLSHLPQLRSLNVYINLSWLKYRNAVNDDQDNEFITECMIQLISHLVNVCPLLESLVLYLHESSETGDKFRIIQPSRILILLSSLPQLRSFNLYFKALTHSMTADDYKIFHSFPSLTSLSLPYDQEKGISASSPSNIEILDLLAPNDTLDHTILLTHLPCDRFDSHFLVPSLSLCRRWGQSLKRLCIDGGRHTELTEISAECLSAFVNLHELTISIQLDAHASAAVVEGMRDTKQQLTSLSLGHLTLSSDQLASIICSMPHLKFLTLNDISGLDSLAFIKSIASRSLTSLWINQKKCSTRMSVSEVDHIFSSDNQLRQLESLDLIDVFSSPISSEIIDSLNRKSVKFDHQRFPYLRYTNIRHSDAAVESTPAPPLVGVELNPGPATSFSFSLLSSSFSSTTVSATSWSSTSDLLQLIFSFLPFRPELMSCCIHVSHSWYTAAHRMPSQRVVWPFLKLTTRSAFTYNRNALPFEASLHEMMISRSPFLYHLTQIDMDDLLNVQSMRQLLILLNQASVSTFASTSTSTSASTSASETSRLLNIEEIRLKMRIDFNEYDDNDDNDDDAAHWKKMLYLALPVTIRSLDFDLSASASLSEQVQSTFSTILIQLSHELCQRNSSLLQSLSISLSFDAEFDEYESEEPQINPCFPPISFLENLSQLPHLREFEYHAPGGRFTLQQLVVMRSFPALTRFRCAMDNFDEGMDLTQFEVLDALVPKEEIEKHPLQLEILPFSDYLTLTDQISIILQRFRWLRELDLVVCTSSSSSLIEGGGGGGDDHHPPPQTQTKAFDFLSQMIHLTQLSISNLPTSRSNPISIESLASHLGGTSMEKLTQLKLQGLFFSPDLMCTLLAHLPHRLTQLTISGFSAPIDDQPYEFDEWSMFSSPEPPQYDFELTFLLLPATSVVKPSAASSSFPPSSHSSPSPSPPRSYMMRVFNRERATEMIAQLKRDFKVVIVYQKK